MAQDWIPAVFMRGGSSKGVFFHARDLPAEQAARDPIILSVLGSPDPYGRQLDGMGGGISSLSKAVVIGPSTHPDADVDYTFAQVAVDRPIVDWRSNCGNLASAAGPFAVDEGLVRVADGEVLVRIHQTNTKKIIHAHFPVLDGKALTEGGFSIAGVAGTGAKIRLDFLDPGGSFTCDLLPTGNVVDQIVLPDGRRLDVSLIDATMPMVYLRASDLGLHGTELPGEIESSRDLMQLLDLIRRRAGVLMGLAASPDGIGLANPRIALVAAPSPFHSIEGRSVDAKEFDIGIRMLSMERAHRAVTLTGAMCLGVACKIEGTIPNLLAQRIGNAPLRLGTPSGVIPVESRTAHDGRRWVAESASVFRTARRLMQGEVAVPRWLLNPQS